RSGEQGRKDAVRRGEAKLHQSGLSVPNCETRLHVQNAADGEKPRASSFQWPDRRVQVREEYGMRYGGEVGRSARTCLRIPWGLVELLQMLRSYFPPNVMPIPLFHLAELGSRNMTRSSVTSTLWQRASRAVDRLS